MPSHETIWLLAASDAWLRRHLEPNRILNSKELARAERFVVEAPRTQFAYARAFLRTALGEALEVSPAQLSLGTGPHGKPFVAGKHWQSGLLFNLSHCDGLTVLVASHNIMVGVDAEQPDRDLDRYRFAARFFHPFEQASLAGLSEDHHRAKFFRIWTQKEAWLKAIGTGLDVPLSSFAVSGDDGAEAALRSWEGNQASLDAWRLCSTQIEGCPVTVCAEAGNWSLKTRLLL